ncbi:hypothetical protein ACF0H5_011358 [Mactra antiquata]
MAAGSSISLMLFYMQSKEMYKLTPQLCRIARQEFEETKAGLPVDVRDDASFNKILELIEYLEKSKYAKANEMLSDAFNEHEEMLSYYSGRKQDNQKNDKTTSRPKENKNPDEPQSIFAEHWEPPVRPDKIPTPPAIQHNINEDDRRNWNNKSPVINKESETARNVTKGNKSPVDKSNSSPVRHESNSPVRNRNNSPIRSKRNDADDISGKGTGDEENNSHRKTYMTTLRPKDGTSKYEKVYVSHSPGVLAEMFTSLYKNEYKTAFEELEHTLGDKQTVRHMLWIIAKSSIICASLATQQLADLENSVAGIMLSRDPLNKQCLVDENIGKTSEVIVTKNRNMLVDYRRELALISVPMLQKEIKRAVASELGTSLPRRFTGIGNHFITYADKCIELIWLMYVHDPPMHLEWLTREQEGASFKTDLYTTYTRPGTLYDYCVWPVVRLHKNGPVLCKGIAQGK